jgi:hypothetical protein
MYSYNSFLEEHLLDGVWIFFPKNEEIFKDSRIETSFVSFNIPIQMGGGASVEVVSSNYDFQSNERPMYRALFDRTNSTISAAIANALPDTEIIVKIAKESLDLLTVDQVPLLLFPFQNIISWGSCSRTFSLLISNKDPDFDRKDYKLVLTTSRGKEIEDILLKVVFHLMDDMKKATTVTKEEFSSICKELFDENNCLREDFLSILKKFAVSRSFIAKQAIDIMNLVSPHAPFERVECALFFYTNIINKDSFQLVLNTFEDESERENLLLRIKGIMDKKKDDPSVNISTKSILIN